MKRIKLAGWIAVMLLIQSVFLRYIRIGGIAPELLYVFLICYTFFENKPNYRLGVGIILGILSGVISNGALSVHLLIYTITTVAEILILELLYQRQTAVVFPLIAIFTFIENTAMFYIYNLNIGYFEAFIGVILPVIIYNLAIGAIFVYVFTRKPKKTFKKRR